MNHKEPDMLADVHVTILAGGSGTRLWPRSRKEHPKQLLDLLGERSLLQQTVDRVLPLVPIERVYILTGPDHAAAIAAQLPGLPAENLFIEPTPRGTAPCLGLAALRLQQRLPGSSVMVSLHADHAIIHEDRFQAALRASVAQARKGDLVTIGVVPAFPDTGFGYVERGELLGQENDQPVYRVVRFTEKPSLERAQEFVDSGRFYWNTGYFSWTLDSITDAFRALLPDLCLRLDQIAADLAHQASDEQVANTWNLIEPVTIDVGIMERASRVAVVPADPGWSDVGNWAALYDLLQRDSEDNVVLGNSLHVGLDTTGTLIYGEGRLIATIGLQDMVVVDTGDALLVLPRARAQDVSRLVKALQAHGMKKYL
ncbi:MAG: mannose-1-phosphate guanylyltransferase [Anaerolineae bacterium]